MTAPSPLAESGARALVGSMGTDVWAATKSGFAYLLGDGDEAAMSGWEERLEASVAAATGDQDGEVQHWQERLTALLSEDPEVEPKLAALVDEIAGRLATGGGEL